MDYNRAAVTVEGKHGDLDTISDCSGCVSQMRYTAPYAPYTRPPTGYNLQTREGKGLLEKAHLVPALC